MEHLAQDQLQSLVKQDILIMEQLVLCQPILFVLQDNGMEVLVSQLLLETVQVDILGMDKHVILKVLLNVLKDILNKVACVFYLLV
jgi:hypothetical protein